MPPAHLDNVQNEQNGQNVKFAAAVSPDSIRRVINIALPVIKMAARFTPNQSDDQVVALVEMLLKDPDFADVLANFLGLFGSAEEAAPALTSAMKAISESTAAMKAAPVPVTTPNPEASV